MCSDDAFAVSEISDGARHAQDAVHGAGGELQPVDGVFEQGLVARVEAAEGVRGRLVEVGVGAAAACVLACAGLHDAGADDFAGFARRCIGTQLRRRQSRHFEVQIDAFKQRAGDAAAVAEDRVGVAAAASRRVAGPAAGA